MKILFTTPVLMHPPAGGPQLRIENSIIALSKISELHLVSRENKENVGGEDAEDFYKQYSENYVYAPSTDPAQVWPASFISRAINKVSYILLKRLPIRNDAIEMDTNFIVDYADGHGIGLIWFGYGNISYPVMKAVHEKRPDLKLVCDTDSVWSRFVLRELPYIEDRKRKEQVKKAGEQKELEEKSWVQFCDITTGVSNVDVEYYKEIAEDKSRIKIFSNVINVDSYCDPVNPPPNHIRPSMYLAGTFWKGSPMEKASRWVLEKVLPIVKESIPNIHFYIIGRGSDTILSDIDDKAVTVTGMVDSVLPYLCNVDVSIVPLTFESGTRFKILEAAACGIPIVSTTLGAEGIPIIHGENILIGDTETEFAESIVKLIQDRDYANNISQNCLELIRENYGIDGLVKEGREILKDLNEAS